MPKNHSINREQVYVRREVPRQRWARRIMLAGLLIVLPLLSWWGAVTYLGRENQVLQQEVVSLRSNLTALQAQVETLRQERADFQVASDMDKETLDQLRQRLVEWREANQQLEEQNQFYMSLMNPEPGESGVIIESIAIQSTFMPQQYDYSALVAQRAVDHQRVNGRLEISVEGVAEGQQQTLSTQDLGIPVSSLVLGFRYFQQLNGQLWLPEGFQPERVRLQVYLSGSSSPLIDRTTAWPH